MTTYAWPDDLGIESMEWGMERATVRLDNPTTKAVQVVDLLSYQWVVQVGMPPRAMFQAGKLEALMNTLVGGVDRVTLYRKDRPVPMGTLRGSPTLASSVAQFSDTLVLADAWDLTRRNLLLWSQDMGNAAWSKISGASITSGTGAAPDGSATADMLALSATVNSRAEQSISGLTPTAGSTYTFSVWMKGSGTLHMVLDTSSGVGGVTEVPIVLTGDFVRYVCTVTYSGTPTGNVRAMLVHRSGDTATNVWCWGSQVESGAVATDYIMTTSVAAGAPVKLLAGDMIGVSPQLFQVHEDAASNSLGQMTVKLTNRTRSSLASGLPVVWDRPKATFLMEDDRSAFTFSRMHMDRSTFRFREAV